MISVSKAEKLLLAKAHNYGTEKISIGRAPGRILAEPILADRDFPPGNRATMDGIAINYKSFAKNQREFSVKALQPAGHKAVEIDQPNQCVQVMTGSILGKSVDTVVRVEDLALHHGFAHIKTDNVLRHRFVHRQGTDKKQGETIMTGGQIITSKIMTVLASTGHNTVRVKKLPKIIIITTGDELVGVDQKPQNFQIRRSNDWMMRSVLSNFLIKPASLCLPDNKMTIKGVVGKSLKNYDVILLSGGVSKGQFDHVQTALDELGMHKVFHGVAQHPGKPFWFGIGKKTRVFAFPGNPVSLCLCLHRYFLPWLNKSLGIDNVLPIYAVLSENVTPDYSLTQFLPVSLSTNKSGQLMARPVKNNGSGDFISLVSADAFAELPQKSKGQKGDICKVWHIM